MKRGGRVRKERERRETEKKERERGEEMEKRKERRKNIIWRGIEGGSVEKRRRVMEEIVMEELGRRGEICEVRER